MIPKYPFQVITSSFVPGNVNPRYQTKHFETISSALVYALDRQKDLRVRAIEVHTVLDQWQRRG